MSSGPERRDMWFWLYLPETGKPPSPPTISQVEDFERWGFVVFACVAMLRHDWFWENFNSAFSEGFPPVVCTSALTHHLVRWPTEIFQNPSLVSRRGKHQTWNQGQSKCYTRLSVTSNEYAIHATVFPPENDQYLKDSSPRCLRNQCRVEMMPWWK